MRCVVIIAILAATAAAATAEKITVAQLDQLLATNAVSPEPVTHRSASPEEIPDLPGSDILQQHDDTDAEMVEQIAAVELLERLSTTSMFRLIWKYHLSPPVQLALEQLSDRTALLDLPSNEKPNLAAPDAAAQKAMLAAAQSWVGTVLSHLPNFIATQTTTRFDDAVPLSTYSPTSQGPGLHRVGSVQRRITFRDGKEVTDEAHGSAEQKSSRSRALESRGEFGTEAAVVLMDVQKGTVAFSHWEQTMAGVAAVYAYTVPRGSSHYEIVENCGGHGLFRDAPGYHGTLALEPKTGAIFRMTLEADSNAGDPVSHVASVIEYGPVVLGHQRSICPLRSLTFMVEEGTGCARLGRRLQKPVSMINQTIFSNYQRFGSSTNIIFSEAENEGAAAGQNAKIRPEKGVQSGSQFTESATMPNKQP